MAAQHKPPIPEPMITTSEASGTTRRVVAAALQVEQAARRPRGT